MKLILFGFLVLFAASVCHGQEDAGSDEGEDDLDEGMSIDEIIASAQTVNQMDYLTDLTGETQLQDMDMLLLREQYEALLGESSRKKRKAVRSKRYRWTEKTIPYVINSRVFGGTSLTRIHSAMNEWQKYTCLRFTRRTSQRNYVYFDNGSGCYSYVGMTGGAQTIGLAPGCRYHGVIVHEVGHAVGFHHEQNRPDRDQYVYIRRENIPSNLYYNFKKYSYEAVDLHGVPYDYGSIMHYGGTAFSTNGRLTIQTKNSADQNKIGNRRGLSFRDIKLANLMYSCNEGCPSKTCPGEGFVGKDCKCYCPGNPIQECSGTSTGGKVVTTTRRPVGTTRSPCRNMNSRCELWAREGYCSSSAYMHMYCKPACNLCKTEPEEQCMDDNQNCPNWKMRGFCQGRYAAYMRNNCMMSCGFCRPRYAEKDGYASEQDGQGESKSAGLTASFWAIFSSLLMLVVTCLPLQL